MERRHLLDRLIGNVSLIALHEAGALEGHATALAERVRLARRARGVAALLREQLDLIPEERNRWRDDHAARRALWRGLVADLRG